MDIIMHQEGKYMHQDRHRLEEMIMMGSRRRKRRKIQGVKNMIND
jgi:hypothetical protein